MAIENEIRKARDFVAKLDKLCGTDLHNLSDEELLRTVDIIAASFAEGARQFEAACTDAAEALKKKG